MGLIKSGSKNNIPDQPIWNYNGLGDFMIWNEKNMGAGSGLDADTLDGRQPERLYESYLSWVDNDYKKWIIDLTNTSTYDKDTYYPCVFKSVFSTPSNYFRRIFLRVSLNGEFPVQDWMSHSSGFSMYMDFSYLCAGWGGAVPLFNLNAFYFSHVKSGESPILKVEQLTYHNEIVLYLRGGGKYTLFSDSEFSSKNIYTEYTLITEYPSGTGKGQSVEPHPSGDWTGKLQVSGFFNSNCDYSQCNGIFLPTSGGTVSGLLTIKGNHLDIDTTVSTESTLRFKLNSENKGAVGYMTSNGTYLYNYKTSKYIFNDDNGNLKFGTTSALKNVSLEGHKHAWSDITGTPSFDLPIASATTLGGIKVGAGLTIDSSGILSATGGGEADSVHWNNIVGKPSTFTPSSHTHTKAQITDFPTTWDWSEISGKPSTFTPSNHTHTKAQITDFPTSWDWANISNKPSTFAPSEHVHNQYLELAGGTMTGEIDMNNHWIRNVTDMSLKSDSRVKKDITDLDLDSKDVDDILGLKLKNYKLKNYDGIIHTGFIAQEVLKYLPKFKDVVIEENGLLALNYRELSLIREEALIFKIKELERKYNELLKIVNNVLER